MRRIKALVLAVVATCFAGGGAAVGQNVIPARKVAGPLREVKAPLVVNGVEVTPLVKNGQKSATTAIYDNTWTNGWYSAWGLGLWYDWGLVTASDNELAATHHVVTEITIGWGSHYDGRNGLDLFIYEGSTGWCSTNGIGNVAAAFSFTGLPGRSPWCWGTGWTFSFDLDSLSGPGNSSCFELEQGPIGYAYDFYDDNNWGPLLVGRPNPSGVQDVFDFYDTTGQTCLGSYWFGGYGSTNPFASFFLQLGGAQGFAKFPRASDPYPCLTTCGGDWSLEGSGCPCDGQAFEITATCSVPYVNPGEHSAALLVSASGQGRTAVFATGCSLDVVLPFAIVVLGDASSPRVLQAAFPAGTPDTMAATMQLLVQDRGDSGCAQGAPGVRTSNVLVAYGQ